MIITDVYNNCVSVILKESELREMADRFRDVNNGTVLNLSFQAESALKMIIQKRING